MHISHTPQAVSKTPKYIKKNKDRSANYHLYIITILPPGYHGHILLFLLLLFATDGISMTAVKSDIDTEEWRV